MLVVLPITHESSEIETIVAKVTNKARRRDEIIRSTWNVWMPYHRIWIKCLNIDTSRSERVVTALNAAFCTSTRTDSELLQLFRPRHLNKPLKEIDPDPTEIICAHPAVDLEALLQRLIKIRIDAIDQLSEIEPQLVKAYRRMQWQYLFLPTTTGSLQREREASAKLAELQSRLLAVEVCLNLTGSLIPQNIEEHDVFYAPMAVVHLKLMENTSSRYVLVDLTTGKADLALTNLCELNDDFKSRLELALK